MLWVSIIYTALVDQTLTDEMLAGLGLQNIQFCSCSSSQVDLLIEIGLLTTVPGNINITQEIFNAGPFPLLIQESFV